MAKDQEKGEKDGTEKTTCCQKFKGCMGRVPWASLISAALIVFFIILILILLNFAIGKFDDVMITIGVNMEKYTSYKQKLTIVTYIILYTTLGFVGFMLAVAIASSGKNRDCLEKHRCCRANLLIFVILIMVMLAIIYLIILVILIAGGMPLTLSLIGTGLCRTAEEQIAAAKKSQEGKTVCLDLDFLGPNVKKLCNYEVGPVCDSLDNILTAAIWILVSFIGLNIGLVMALVTFGSNYAYVKSVKKEKPGEATDEEAEGENDEEQVEVEEKARRDVEAPENQPRAEPNADEEEEDDEITVKVPENNAPEPENEVTGNNGEAADDENEKVKETTDAHNDAAKDDGAEDAADNKQNSYGSPVE